MSLLIAVAGLFAAIYSVLPRERRLDLRLRVTILDVAIVIAAFSAIIYLEYYPFVLSHPIHGFHLAPPLVKWPHDLAPANLPDLILLISIAFVAIRVRWVKLSHGNVTRFARLLDELYWVEGYEEIFNFLERHSRELFRIQAQASLLARVKQWLSPRHFMNQFWKDMYQTHPTDSLKWQQFCRTLQDWSSTHLTWLRRMLPDYKKSSDVVEDILNNVVLSESFINHLVHSRPYLGVTLMQEWGTAPGRGDFIEAYIWKLMEEPSSIFYSELRKNQNLTFDDRYQLPGANAFLHYFLADAKVAEDNAPYKPIGDYVLMLLDDLGQNPSSDPYNRALGHFSHDQWKSPLYGAIQFFDVMVREALHQGITWHMWLYYFPPIVEKMARNYRVNDPFSDADREFPNRYAYLIYEIFECLRDWVTASSSLPVGQANVTLDRIDAEHENGNIPKSSIRALSEALYYVLISENVAERQQDDLTDMVFRLYFELRATSNFRAYATVLLACLKKEKDFRSGERLVFVDALQRGFSRERMEYSIKFGFDERDELEAFVNGL